MAVEKDIRECANCGRFQSGGYGCGKYVNTCMQDGDAYSHWIPRSEETSMKDNYRILVDTKEFQQKILDYINSGEIDEMINSTVFKDKPECRSAIIHGMAIASMLTSSCEPFCIIEKGK